MTSPWVTIRRDPKSSSGRRCRRKLVELCCNLHSRNLMSQLFAQREESDDRVADVAGRETLVAVAAAAADETVMMVSNLHLYRQPWMCGCQMSL